MTVECLDARSRFAKSVRVYAVPHLPTTGGDGGGGGGAGGVAAAAVASELRDRGQWVHVGSLALPRSKDQRARCRLPVPITTAYLVLEFAEFHGGDEENEGVRLCPRCGRGVSDAHGICTSCSETTFQCRQCRHINYEV